jgi:hypothetical protein
VETVEEVKPKDAYLQANENWRFLAKWRQIAFAAQLAILAGALSFANVAAEHSFSRAVAVPCFLFVAFLSLVLRMVDRRTHKLTMHACKASVELEGGRRGFFSVNKNLDAEEKVQHGPDPSVNKKSRVPEKLRRWWHWDGHSKAADLLCLGSVLVSLWLAIFAVFGGLSSTTRTKEPWDYRVLHGALVGSLSSGSASLDEQLNRASEDGWELFSTGTDATNGTFLILRRRRN